MAGVAVIVPEGRISEVQIEGLVSLMKEWNGMEWNSINLLMRESHFFFFLCFVFRP